jgi:hypothetical protein
MHGRRTIQTTLAAFTGNIYQKHVPKLFYPTTKKYINLKSYLTNNFCVGKAIISQRIQSRIQKGFSP